MASNQYAKQKTTLFMFVISFSEECEKNGI